MSVERKERIRIFVTSFEFLSFPVCKMEESFKKGYLVFEGEFANSLQCMTSDLENTAYKI